MTTTPEGRVKTAIKKYLDSIGAYYFMPIGGPFTVHGVPDIIACHRGFFLGIECKAPGKKEATTPNQKAHLARIAGAGGFSMVADCWEDVKLAIETSWAP